MAHHVVGVEIAQSGLKVCALEMSMRGAQLRSMDFYGWDTPLPDLRDLKEAAAESLTTDDASSLPEEPSAQSAEPPSEAAESEEMSVSDTSIQRKIDQIQEKAPPPEEAPLSLVSQLLRAKVATWVNRADEIFVGFDGRKAALHPFTIPVTDVSKLETTLLFELEDTIPQDIEQMSYGYTATQRLKSATDVLAAVAYKSDIERVLRDVRAGGVHLRALYYEPLALMSLLPEVPKGAAKPPATVVICIGEERTHILLCKNNVPIYARTLREGVTTVDAHWARLLNLDEAQGKQRREALTHSLMQSQSESLAQSNEAGEPENSPALSSQNAMTPQERQSLSETLHLAFRAISSSVKQTIKPFRRQLDAPVIYVTGQIATLPECTTWLSRDLGMTTTLLPLPPALERLSDGHACTFSYALAVAGSRALSQPKIDFRSGELAEQGDFSQFREQGFKILYALCAILFFAFVSAAGRYYLLREDEQALDQTLREVTKSITGREIEDYKQALAIIHQGGGKESTSIPKSSAFDVLTMISKKIPKELDVRIYQMDIRLDNKVSLKAEAANFDTKDKLVDVLKSEPCFKQFDLPQAKSIEGKVDFEIRFDMGC